MFLDPNLDGQDRWVQLTSRRLLCLGGVPHPDGAICEALPPEIDEIGHALAQARGISGWGLIC